MSLWRKGLMAVVGVGIVIGLTLGPAQAASKGAEKTAKGATKAPSQGQAKARVAQSRNVRGTGKVASARGAGKAMPPVSMRIRPAQMAAVPPPPPREPVLLPVAIDEDPAGPRPGKVVPIRAYARDGSSFYQNGQVIRVQGLKEGGAGGEHAKQRLQQLLDAGQVTVLPVGDAAGAEMVAEVRVNGRDVAQTLAASP